MLPFHIFLAMDGRTDLSEKSLNDRTTAIQLWRGLAFTPHAHGRRGFRRLARKRVSATSWRRHRRARGSGSDIRRRRKGRESGHSGPKRGITKRHCDQRRHDQRVHCPGAELGQNIFGCVWTIVGGQDPDSFQTFYLHNKNNTNQKQQQKNRKKKKRIRWHRVKIFYTTLPHSPRMPTTTIGRVGQADKQTTTSRDDDVTMSMSMLLAVAQRTHPSHRAETVLCGLCGDPRLCTGAVPAEARGDFLRGLFGADKDHNFCALASVRRFLSYAVDFVQQFRQSKISIFVQKAAVVNLWWRGCSPGFRRC